MSTTPPAPPATQATLDVAHPDRPLNRLTSALRMFTIIPIALVLGSTILLELLQLLAPSRHGRVIDVLVKLVGSGFGIAIGALLQRLRGFRRIS